MTEKIKSSKVFGDIHVLDTDEMIASRAFLERLVEWVDECFKIIRE